MMPIVAAIACTSFASAHQTGPDSYLAGDLIVPTGERVERAYNQGFSMYVAAWPLQSVYPGHRFQTGLPGTWMFAQYDGPGPKDMYSDVEGGLGWWTDTRFATTTPKFIMGGVGPNFSEIANGPSHGAGSWEDPKGLYGVAQLSPWLLFPIDGLNVKQGACGELFGYGYLNLPLLDPKPTTDGQDVPTGGNCWTLFLSTANFKGPVAFFTPYFWSHCGLKEPRLVGQLLDTRPMDPNMAIQMETQYIPCRVAVDSKGESYARIAPTSFPVNRDGRSALLHHSTSYDRRALWNAVSAWFKGGPPAPGAIDPEGAFPRTYRPNGYATWEIRIAGPNDTETKVPLDWNAFASFVTLDSRTFGLEWKSAAMGGRLTTLPEYYHLVNAADKNKARWEPIPVDQVPGETGLTAIVWKTPDEGRPETFSTPNDPSSCWKKPGPAAGPFKAHLGDGTVVTYYWYRFADQPALLNAGLTAKEREGLQARVEKIHRAWTKDRTYLALPAFGKLASIDPALIVKPPKGLEVGYVPIATRQEPARP